MELKENITGLKACYKSEVNIRIKEKSLIFDFICEQNSNNSYSEKYNDPIYKGDVVEAFIDVGEKDHYLEVEVAPNGTMFLANIHNPDSKVLDTQFLPSDIIKSSVSRRGTTWYTTLIVDLSNYSINLNELELNVFRIETDKEISEKHLFALSPTMCGSFHIRKSFVRPFKYK